MLNVSRVVAVAFVVALSGCAVPQPTSVTRMEGGFPVTYDLRPKFVLISWQRPDGDDAFALFSADEMWPFLERFRRTDTHLSFADLERRIRSLPKACLLTWMADPAKKLEWPRPDLKARVKQLAAASRIDLQLNSITTEDTGI